MKQVLLMIAVVALVGCGRCTRRGDKPNLSPSTLFAIRQM